MKIVIVAGIPGSGKTSILEAFLREMPAVPVVNYGDKMVEEAGIGRDSLRKLSFKEQQEIGQRAAEKMAGERGDGVVIIDTHALVKTSTGFCPGLPLRVLEILAPRAYVVVECAPELIVERRGKDRERSRDRESIEELAMHQELTRSFLAACCMYTGSLLCPIQNHTSSLSENVKPLVRLVQSL